MRTALCKCAVARQKSNAVLQDSAAQDAQAEVLKAESLLREKQQELLLQQNRLAERRSLLNSKPELKPEEGSPDAKELIFRKLRDGRTSSSNVLKDKV